MPRRSRVGKRVSLSFFSERLVVGGSQIVPVVWVCVCVLYIKNKSFSFCDTRGHPVHPVCPCGFFTLEGCKLCGHKSATMVAKETHIYLVGYDARDKAHRPSAGRILKPMFSTTGRVQTSSYASAGTSRRFFFFPKPPFFRCVCTPCSVDKTAFRSSSQGGGVLSCVLPGVP